MASGAMWLSVLAEAGSAAAFSFSSAFGSPFPVAGAPQAIGAGDFNKDGRVDLVVVGQQGGVSVLLGRGAGRFKPASGSPFVTGGWHSSVAIGDVNGDGRLDFVTNNSARAGSVSVLLGNGRGRFTEAPGSPVAVSDGPQSVAVADFNNDGKLDLAVTNWLSDNVSILLGNGNGGFKPAHGSPIAVGQQPWSVAVGDFNHDGRPDLATANQQSGDVSVLLGSGAGRFTPAPGSPFAASGGSRWLVVGDFDKDGKPDLAVANRSGGVLILLGNGAGGFTLAPGSPFAVHNAASSLVAGDFNQDGRLDLATTNFRSKSVSVFLGNGKGGFKRAKRSPFAVGREPDGLVVADVNMDHRADLAVANWLDGDVSVLLNIP
jgi:hypothetical protein